MAAKTNIEALLYELTASVEEYILIEAIDKCRKQGHILPDVPTRRKPLDPDFSTADRPTHAGPPRCFIYCRVSKPNKRHPPVSADQQAEDCRRYWETKLKPLGVELYPVVFTDLAVSGGTSFLNRPQGRLLHTALRRGDHVVCFHVSRWFRKQIDALKMRALWKRLDVQMHACDQGHMAFTGTADLVYGILTSTYQFERYSACERAQATSDYRKSVGKNPSYGFHRVPDKKNPAVQVLRRWDEQRELGAYVVYLRDMMAMSLDDIALEINRACRVHKVDCKPGHTMSRDSVHKWYTQELELRKAEEAAGHYYAPTFHRLFPPIKRLTTTMRVESVDRLGAKITVPMLAMGLNPKRAADVQRFCLLRRLEYERTLATNAAAANGLTDGLQNSTDQCLELARPATQDTPQTP